VVTAVTQVPLCDEIDPDKLDMLADWFDADDPRKGPGRGGEVQADLRRWAHLVRGERLWNLSLDAEPPVTAGREQEIRAGERERVAGLLDQAAKAIMKKAIEEVSAGDEEDGLAKVKMSASVSLAANLVRGKVPQQVADLMPPGVTL
jgi:hypothetical protein